MQWIEREYRPTYFGRPTCIPMPTVLAHIYSDEGFAVAADGVEILRDGDKLKRSQKSVRKIFDLSGANRSVACTFLGRVNLFSDDGNEVAFDFIEAVTEAARSISNVPVRDPNELVDALISPVLDSLESVRQSGRISRYPTPEPPTLGEFGNTVLRVCLDGYLGRIPFRTGVRFCHFNQEMLKGWLSAHNLDGNACVTYGSPAIMKLLFGTNDERLAAYRTETCRLAGKLFGEHRHLPVLRDAVEVASSFVAACCDPIAVDIDSNCKNYGGRIHIATITPKDGFQWVPGFLPE